ncbi:MAG: hypothetical protein H7067_06425, partial [Burkholderiales bacterium]|nr:hypothetical protein [Opitutaceae bacterium]
MPTPARLLAVPALAAALLLSACVKPAEQAAPATKAPEPEPFSTAATVAPTQQPSF